MFEWPADTQQNPPYLDGCRIFGHSSAFLEKWHVSKFCNRLPSLKTSKKSGKYLESSNEFPRQYILHWTNGRLFPKDPFELELSSSWSWSIFTLLRTPRGWQMFAIRIIRLHPAHHRRKHQCFVSCSHHCSIILHPLIKGYESLSQPDHTSTNLDVHESMSPSIEKQSTTKSGTGFSTPQHPAFYLDTFWSHVGWWRCASWHRQANYTTPTEPEILASRGRGWGQGRCHQGEIRVVGWLAHKAKLCQTGGWTLFGHESPRATCCIVSWVFLQLRTESFIFYVT